MSIHVQTRVWNLSQAAGSARLVLLAIADHCDDDGFAWPGIERLAKKAKVSERQVQYAITQLIQAGELRRVLRPGRTHTNLYLVVVGWSQSEIRTAEMKAESGLNKVLEWEEHVQRSSGKVKQAAPIPNGEKVQSGPEKVQPAPEKVQLEAEKVKPASPESSVKPSIKPSENHNGAVIEEAEEVKAREAWGMAVRALDLTTGGQLCRILEDARPIGFDLVRGRFRVAVGTQFAQQMIQQRLAISLGRHLRAWYAYPGLELAVEIAAGCSAKKRGTE